MGVLDKSIDEWTDHMAESGFAFKTIEAYVTDVHILASWCRENRIRAFSGLTLARLETYRDHLCETRTNRTVSRHITGIRKWLKWAQEQGHITDNPTDRLKKPTYDPTATLGRNRITMDMVGQVKDDPGTPTAIRDHAILAVLATTGLAARRGAEIMVTDISTRTRTIHVDGELIEFSDEAWQYIADYLSERKRYPGGRELAYLWMSYRRGFRNDRLSVRQIQDVAKYARQAS